MWFFLSEKGEASCGGEEGRGPPGTPVVYVASCSWVSGCGLTEGVTKTLLCKTTHKKRTKLAEIFHVLRCFDIFLGRSKLRAGDAALFSIRSVVLVDNGSVILGLVEPKRRHFQQTLAKYCACPSPFCACYAGKGFARLTHDRLGREHTRPFEAKRFLNGSLTPWTWIQNTNGRASRVCVLLPRCPSLALSCLCGLMGKGCTTLWFIDDIVFAAVEPCVASDMGLHATLVLMIL